ncbi:DUF2155 domain-containing protein [Dongia sp.]|uniref:DUF2155 domain-containing protein n=1 Tax=Dongia sp. TaxID=1977262 RepID=UPI0035AFB5D2
MKFLMAVAAVALLSAAGMQAAHAIPEENVVLRAMDKITARVSTITVPVGGTVAFGSLQITAKACDKHPPEETPEASAYLDVVEEKPGEAPQPRFQGWMFASSPALSALEHPVYDLWVLDCTNDAPAASQPAESAPSKSSTTESGTSQ